MSDGKELIIGALAIAFVIWRAAIRRQRRLIEQDHEDMRASIERGAKDTNL